ncbi:MAG: hypothetical protein MK085_11160 [Phycisphaerales bacterium]|nr:hypothetical protein [Phycisphaerales bacterium]
MKHLVTLPPFLALRLVDMLHEVGIPAETTDMQMGVMGTYPGLAPFTLNVWVLEESDIESAMEVLEVLRSEPPVADRCANCGYDLQGGSGADRCPECGAAVVAENHEEWWTCEGCGEMSPLKAEECWRCAAPGIEEHVSQPSRSKSVTSRILVRVVIGFLLLNMVGGVIYSVIQLLMRLFT